MADAGPLTDDPGTNRERSQDIESFYMDLMALAGEAPRPAQRPRGQSGSARVVPASWRAIAKEVIWRKRLLIAAKARLDESRIENSLTLATVDVFVEKAQKELTDRAKLYRWWGAACATTSLGLMVGGAALLWTQRDNVETPTEVFSFVLMLLRTSTAVALGAGAILLLIDLARALLHEMVVLYQRRHALRVGRLFVYLHPHDIVVEDLQKAFNWNAEYRSGFKDMRGDRIVSTPVTRLMETGERAAEAVVGAAKAVTRHS